MARNNQTFKAVLKLQTEQFKKEANSVKRTLGSLQKSFMGFAAAMGAGLGFAQLVGTLRKTALELSTAEATLKNVSKETKTFTDGTRVATVEVSNYAENLKYLDKLATKYKQDLVVLTDSFAKFSAAASTANVSMSVQRDVFESLTRASTFFHMSGDRTQQMLVAIEQMFSKGRISAEELRRQLANNLPGAFGLMAQAMGVSNAELDKMMKNGEVLAGEALPKFAKELNKVTKDLDTNSLQLAQNELKTAIQKFTKSSGFEDLYKNILQLTTWFINKLRTSLNTMTGAVLGALGAAGMRKIFRNGLKEWDAYVSGVQKDINKLEKDFGKASGEFKQKYGLDPVKQKGVINEFGKHPDGKKMYEEYKAIIDVQRQIRDKQSEINGVTGILTKSVKGLGVAFKAVGKAIKAAFSTIAFTALLSGIGALIGVVSDYITALRKAKHAVADFKGEMDKLANSKTPAAKEVEGWVKSLKELDEQGKAGGGEWVKYIGEINKLMGEAGTNTLKVADNYQTIIEKVQDWMKMLGDVKRYDYAVQKQIEAEEELAEVQKKIQKIKNGGEPTLITSARLYKLEQEEKSLQGIISEAQKVQDELRFNVDEYRNQQDGTGGDTGGGKDKNPFKDTVEKQKQALKELENQFKAGAYTEEEYKKELDKIIVSTFETITAFDEFKKALNDIGEGEWFDEIAGKFREIKQAALDAAAAEAEAERIAKMKDDMDKTLTNVKDYYSSIRGKDGVRGKRDTTFDYKKSESDKISGELDIINTQIEELEDNIKAANTAIENGWIVASTDLKRYTDLLKQAQKDAQDLNDKLVIAQLQEDISNYEKQMFDGMASGIKSTATAMDRLVTSTKNLFETMNNPDASAWEQIMAVFNQIVQVFDTITGLIELFNTLSTLSNTLSEAKQAMNAKELAMKEQEIGLVGALSTAEVAEGTAAAQAAMMKASAYKISQAALTNMAFAAGAGNAMAVPYPANLAALGSNQAAITEMILAGKAIAAFAKGGIVGGNSTTGDRNLVRVNSGELILNKAQQGNLFSLLNGKGKLGGGEVQFKIKGADLVGTLNNYNQRIRG